MVGIGRFLPRGGGDDDSGRSVLNDCVTHDTGVCEGGWEGERECEGGWEGERERGEGGWEEEREGEKQEIRQRRRRRSEGLRFMLNLQPKIVLPS